MKRQNTSDIIYIFKLHSSMIDISELNLGLTVQMKRCSTPDLINIGIDISGLKVGLTIQILYTNEETVPQI